uniref:Headcase N-terminal domain-containing protein n=1 Tax=Panagrolaimus superbus TaxID=310955 RepID=A0A914YZL3_9BILA
MRDKKFIKEQLQKVKKQKQNIEAKSKEEEGIVRDRNGEIKCCIPFMECTRIGHPLPETMADGVKMCCTNSECAYAKRLVHIECFRSLEQNLMTLMAVKGYDKSVTENVRINNDRLWIKKGLALTQKNLKCACGKGQIIRDNDAWEEREKLYGPPIEEKEKKKKTKTTTLPSIITNVKARVAPPPHEAKKLRELDSHFLSRRSPPPEDTFLAEKYGSTIKPKNTAGFAPKPTYTNKFPPSRPPALNAWATPKAPVKKYPIGFAPIERKPVQKVEEDTEESESSDPETEEVEKENNIKNDEWKESTATPQQSNSIKANETIFPHYHYSFNPNPNLKNALVQTDETNFPAALKNEPWLKIYSSKDSFDSGLGSVSPKEEEEWKDNDSQSYNYSSTAGFNSGRSSVMQEIPCSSNLSSVTERYQGFTKISFVFLNDGRFGVEINRNGTTKLLKNIFGNEWSPLYFSMAEETYEIGETAEYHHHDYPKHVIYDILKIIGKQPNEIPIDPRWGFQITNHNGGIGFEIETPNGRRLMPEESVIAAFFKGMKMRAETYFNEDIHEICLATNFNVSESQRNVFNRAALKVKLEIKLFSSY